MKKKSMYESPETEIVSLRVFTPILQNDDPIHEGGVSKEGVFDAKDNDQDVVPDDEIAAPIKDVWSDEEKIDK